MRTLIDPEACEKGWNVIAEAPIREAVAEDQEGVVADDKSYIESESDTIVVIRDPKNNAKIRLAAMLPK